MKIHAEPSLQRHVPRALGRASAARLRHRDHAAVFEEVAFVEFGGPAAERSSRLEQMRALTYNDLAADRNVVAAVQAMEAILRHHAEGRPGRRGHGEFAEAGIVAVAAGAGRGGVLVFRARLRMVDICRPFWYPGLIGSTFTAMKPPSRRMCMWTATRNRRSFGCSLFGWPEILVFRPRS